MQLIFNLSKNKLIGKYENNTEYRGSFLYLEDKLQDEIVKYIFEEERKQRRRSK